MPTADFLDGARDGGNCLLGVEELMAEICAKAKVVMKLISPAESSKGLDVHGQKIKTVKMQMARVTSYFRRVEVR